MGVPRDLSRSDGMTVFRTMREVGLWVVAALGGLCILLFLAALWGGYTLILFKTGSMAPTIPASSVALVHAIPGSEIRVGDIVTVDRPGGLPVTHRVTGVEYDGERALFTMRGDANADDDAVLYEAAEVRRVVGSVPGLAPLIQLFSRPEVLGTVSVLAALGVTVAFWPRREKLPAAGGSGGAPRGIESGHKTGEPPRVGERRAARAAARTGGTGGTVLVVLGGLLLTAPGLAAPVSAHARPTVERVVEGRSFRITTVGSADIVTVRPGVDAVVQFGIEENPGQTMRELSFRVSAEGELAAELRVDIELCPERWSADSCAGEGTLVTRGLPALALQDLGMLTAPSEPLWVRLSARLADDAEPGPARQAAIRLDASASGETLTSTGQPGATGVDPGLARTGVAPFGVLLLGAGLLLAGLARRRTRRTS